MQGAALETLASGEFISSKALALGKVQPQSREVPQPVLVRLDQVNERDGSLIEFLNILASEYDLLGPNGLKARSGLLEYRYDAV